uniref:Uncharacterized protein n=1 Tax=Zea mays TaxID=4577 RepID=B6U348_MAIZE|nr:hypothetical protein [Zea mays]
MATVTEEVAPVVTVSEEPAPEAAKEVVEKPEEGKKPDEEGDERKKADPAAEKEKKARKPRSRKPKSAGLLINLRLPSSTVLWHCYTSQYSLVIFFPTEEVGIDLIPHACIYVYSLYNMNHLCLRLV